VPKRIYAKTTWENEIPNGTPNFEIVEYDSSIIATAATIVMNNEVVAGTPVNAANLNKMETGIYNAQTTANEAVDAADKALGAANLAQGDADQALLDAAAAQSSADAAQADATEALLDAAAAQSSADAAQADATEALGLIGKLPYFSMKRNASQSIPNGTYTRVLFDTEIYDPYGFINIGTYNQGITVPVGFDGVYLFFGFVHFDVDSDGARRLQIVTGSGGSGYVAGGITSDQGINAGVANFMPVHSAPLPLAAGAKLGLEVWHNANDGSGNPLNLSSAFFWGVKIG
jgi:hypothetical protein